MFLEHCGILDEFLLFPGVSRGRFEEEETPGACFVTL